MFISINWEHVERRLIFFAVVRFVSMRMSNVTPPLFHGTLLYDFARLLLGWVDDGIFFEHFSMKNIGFA